MVFLTDNDFKVVVGDSALKAISQASDDVKDNAVLEAIEEMSGYLRPQYDVDKIFSATGTQRHRQIVMYCCDISLYHMISAMPQRMGSEVREQRYKRAIEWLEDVQAGKIVPALPAATDDEGEETGSPIRYGTSFNPIW